MLAYAMLTTTLPSDAVDPPLRKVLGKYWGYDSLLPLQAAMPFHKGDAVDVVDGGLAGASGFFECYEDMDRVVLLLDMLGRQMRVKLPAATIAATGASEIWVTHGQEDALVHWSKARGLKARPLAIVGYGDEDESDGTTDGKTGETMKTQ